MIQNKKIIFGLILLAGVLLISLNTSSDKKIKGDKAFAKKSVQQNDSKLTESEKKDYGLLNPFTENDLMPFSVQSDTAIVFDVDSGKVLYSKYPDTKRPTASISKIMTAIVTIENSNPEDILEVSQKAADMEPNKIVMKAGEKMKVDDLLYGLMMISANDAAEVLAEGVFGDRGRFIEEMNKKAEWLDLKNTHFVTPSGLDDPEHYSTPYDMSVITRYAIKKHPDILKYMGTKEYSVLQSDQNESHWWQHISGMLSSYPGMDGVKTGYTWDAGNTFLGTAKRDNKRIGVVVFNTQSAASDLVSLFDYGFQSAN